MLAAAMVKLSNYKDKSILCYERKVIKDVKRNKQLT